MSPRPVDPDAAGLLARVAELLTPPGAWDRDARGTRGPSWNLIGALYKVLLDYRYSSEVWGDAIYLLVKALRARADAGPLAERAYAMPSLKRFNDESATVDRVLELLAEARKAAPS